MLHILIVDDHLLVRDGIKRLVDDADGMEVVGEASDGREGARLAERLRPHIVLMDGSMPVCNGIEATHVIAESCPDVKVIAVTRNDDAAFVRAMLGAGAAGYVLKQNASTELIRAVRAVAVGERYLDRSPATNRPPPITGAGVVIHSHHHEPLTPDEEDVLRLVAAFYTNSEIAAQLSRDVDDVANAKASAMQKLGLSTRVQLVAYAEREGWRHQPERVAATSRRR